MLKQKITALCAAVVMSSAVLADDLTVSQPVSISHANAFDESKVFEMAPNQSLQAVELSEQEMKETEGELLPAVLAGMVESIAEYYIREYLENGNLDNVSVEGVVQAAIIGGTFGGAGKALTVASGGSKAAHAVWTANSEVLSHLTSEVINAISMKSGSFVK